ncbi:MAG: DNA-binding protein [Candidatus Rokuibacteriota bacterium]|nr:MAG: DNA-binding protein [Candidatus Rokubacteria bacterium]
MKPSQTEANRWLAQAESDLAFAEVGVREGFHAQACFICQQAAEKALKALHYWRGARLVFGHSLVELLDDLGRDDRELGRLREAAQQLDQYYIPTRYPNGLPGGVPADVFSRRQAVEAVAFARDFIAEARRSVGGRQG